MSMGKIVSLLLDSSYIKTVGFSGPDFQKLLQLSQDKKVRIFIPHIVLEEIRTQQLDSTIECLNKISKGITQLSGQLSRNFLLAGLPPPAATIWKESEVDLKSKNAMREWANEKRIEVVPIAEDHAERAWDRYFTYALPFERSSEDREIRRKHIPDSWILEAAIDVRAKHPDLIALCPDKNLAGALRASDIHVCDTTEEVLERIYKTVEMPTEIIPKIAAGTESTESLQLRVAEKLKPFENVEAKILGYVGYFDQLAKTQLFDLLSKSGISMELGKNAAEKLVIANLIMDTGNHYLPKDKEVCSLAAAAIELDVIKLIQK